MLWSTGGRHHFNNQIWCGTLLSIGLDCCRVLGWDVVEHRGKTPIYQLNSVWDAVECWIGVLLSIGSGCCGVSGEDTDLITEFGMGRC